MPQLVDLLANLHLHPLSYHTDMAVTASHRRLQQVTEVLPTLTDENDILGYSEILYKTGSPVAILFAMFNSKRKSNTISKSEKEKREKQKKANRRKK